MDRNMSREELEKRIETLKSELAQVKQEAETVRAWNGNLWKSKKFSGRFLAGV